MNLINFVLIALPTLIWSSTWFVIKFQIGIVDPMVSVVYRYALSGLIMLIYCWLAKKKLKHPINIHGLFLLEGLFLFGLNYWLIYMAELHLTSGLIAVVFSMIVFFNVIFSRLFLKRKIRYQVLIAGLLGIIGIWFLFKQEINNFNLTDKSFLALIFCFLSLVFASLGNIIAARLSELKVQVMEANTFGMLYGALGMIIVTLITGKAFIFDWSFNYISSLSYLVIFGSIIAFAAYIKTLVRIGPDRAAYALISIPIISMLISSIFESYIWTLNSFLGIGLIVIGNLIVLRVK